MARLEWTPGAPLNRHVASVWIARHAGLTCQVEAMLPTGSADLVIPLHADTLPRAMPDQPDDLRWLRGGVLQGASDRAVLRVASGPLHVLGVHFRPGGAAAVLGGLALEASGSCVALADLDRGRTDLREHLLEQPDDPARLRAMAAVLIRGLARHGARAADPLVERAVAALDAAPSDADITALARTSGLSPGAFATRFARRVGLTPKRYARVRRLEAVLHALRARGAHGADGLAEVALACGFADQTHLAHEFRRMTGTTPLRYRAGASAQPHHVALR